MPRRQNHKLCIHEKRHQARYEPQSHRGVQPAAVMEELPSTSSLLEDNSQSSSATGSNSTSQGSLEAPSTTSTFSTTSDTTSDVEDTSQDEEDSGSSNVSSSTENTYSDTLNSMTSLLEQFLLHKYKIKYHKRFVEILKRASEHIEAVFAVGLKEVDSTIHSYDLVSKLNLPNNGRLWDGRGLPKTGLLMTVLGVIFVKGNCAAEEDIWKFLNMMRVYAGRKHFIYGEPRKLITKDFVTMKYLEYRQVANGDPPRYEFLWGPRAHVETSKMKVLEFLAKVNDTVPSAFSSQYEEALRDEEERARATVPARNKELQSHNQDLEIAFRNDRKVKDYPGRNLYLG
uniref:MAGE domain-containing protein n=1 Tax=Bos mutus grunniens TaxID=30521 RepID=A0A8B9XA26_BOSMU